MAQDDQAIAIEMTPATEVAFAVFKEVDWPLPLIVPTGVNDFGDLIDDQQGAGEEDGVHGPIL